VIRLLGDSRHLPDLLKHAFLDRTDFIDGVDASILGGVPCVVGSPPYNVAIPNYPSGYPDHLPWAVYRAYAYQWARGIAGVLCPGGRAWVNVQQTVPMVPGEPGGRRVNLAGLWMWALEKAGLEYRDTICWVQDSFDGACAWGSWLQPSAPNLRGSSELILLYYRPPWARPIPKEWKGRPQPRGVLLGEDGEPVLAEDGKVIPDPAVPGGPWEDLVRNVWKINPANPGTWHTKDETGARIGPRKNLPALYPIDLPARAIRLSTWPGEWVVDPWAGHCTTGFAADQLGRRSVMVDIGFDAEEA